MSLKNKKAYLCRPNEKILVEVATITITDSPSPSPLGQSGVLSSSCSVNRSDSSLDTQAILIIRNGTNVSNLAGMDRDSLSLEKYLRVVAVEDAVNKNYKQSVVVVLNEAYEQHGIALARKYGVVPVIVPPQGEPIP